MYPQCPNNLPEILESKSNGKKDQAPNYSCLLLEPWVIGFNIKSIISILDIISLSQYSLQTKHSSMQHEMTPKYTGNKVKP